MSRAPSPSAWPDSLRAELLRRLAGSDRGPAAWLALGDAVAFREVVVAGRPVVVVALVEPLALIGDAALGGLLGLSPRQAAVARRLVRRRTAREIAAELELAPSTVRGHTEAVYQRLGVHSRDELAGIVTARLLDALVGEDVDAGRSRVRLCPAGPETSPNGTPSGAAEVAA